MCLYYQNVKLRSDSHAVHLGPISDELGHVVDNRQTEESRSQLEGERASLLHQGQVPGPEVCSRPEAFRLEGQHSQGGPDGVLCIEKHV